MSPNTAQALCFVAACACIAFVASIDPSAGVLLALILACAST